MKKITGILFFSLFWAAFAEAQIVINEIMYNPPPSGTDTLEYIELHNPTNAAVDISGWNFTQGVEYTFAAGTTIPAGGYVIVCENKAYFDERFPGVVSYEWIGALTNTGEDIELRDANANIKDYVDYSNAAPWPSEPNNFGPSLVLAILPLTIRCRVVGKVL